MAKRSSSLEGVFIALALLERIPATHMVTASQLHEQLLEAGLVRDQRTTQRYLNTLCEHFDIECDMRSRPYGYRWKPNARGLSFPRLNEQQSLLLTLAEQYLKNLLPTTLMKSMESFFAQARSNLTSRDKTRADRAREWLDKVRVVDTTQPLLPPKIHPAVFEQVSNALYGNKLLELEYRNAEGRQNAYRVMPLGLAQQGPRLYLVARFEGYDNERSLAVHRIVSARATTIEFERPEGFELRKYDDDGRFGFGEGRHVRLSFRIAKPAGLHLLESPLSTDQQVEDLGDEWGITATVVETEQLKWWLRGFGENVSCIRVEPSLDVKPLSRFA
jgi:predicted DNA-binding transcriptional regulator YafY